nr:protamine-like protein 99C [Drosophila takahashii]
MTDKANESESMSLGSWETNGFLNFMRTFRPQSNMGWLDFAEESARCWKRMSQEEKNSYRGSHMRLNAMYMDDESAKRLSEMCNHPMGKQRSAPREKSCSSPRKSCAKPRKSCAARHRKAACSKPRRSPCAKPKCSKPGPVTNNGYLNFVRSFRKKHCGLKPQELIIEAAKAWSKLSEEKKDRYRRMACKVTHNERHKRRRVCNRC